MNSRMKALVADNRFEMTVRWVIGGIFMFASADKIAAPADFAKIIYGYYLFPDFTINLIAIALPFLELFAGMALMLGIYPRSAAALAGALLLFFSIAISINLARGVEFDCGCFSIDEPGYFFSAEQLLIRDILLLAASLYVSFYPKSRKWCLRQTGGLYKTIELP